MKKILAILLVAIMATTLLVACGDSSKGEQIIRDAEKEMAERVEQFRNYYEKTGEMDTFVDDLEQATKLDLTGLRDLAGLELSKLDLSNDKLDELITKLYQKHDDAQVELSLIRWAP